MGFVDALFGTESQGLSARTNTNKEIIHMKAVITGASSGIGACFAGELYDMGYEVVLVARRGDRLRELAEKLGERATILEADIATREGIEAVVAHTDADLLINNAGFGTFGVFVESDVQNAMNMIDVNIKAMHCLMHAYLKSFCKRGKGSVLNVASVAGFAPSPLMAAYYATKGYVVRLTQGVYEELRRTHKNVAVSALCPGPVTTEFNDVAGLSLGIKGLSAEYVAKYALKKHFKGKVIIVPGFSIKLLRILQKLLPTKLMLRLGWKFQSKKP